MKPKNKVYAAGIVDRWDHWEWQGTVVAESAKEAKRLLVEFKKIAGIIGRCEVTTFGGPHFTERKKGVSNLTYLN